MQKVIHIPGAIVVGRAKKTHHQRAQRGVSKNARVKEINYSDVHQNGILQVMHSIIDHAQPLFDNVHHVQC